MIRAIVTLPRAIFAGMLAIVAAAFSFAATERSGDPAYAVADVEQKLGTADAVLRRHTFEVKDAGTPKPTDKSRALYRLSGPKGEILFVEGPSDANIPEVERIVWELYEKKNRQYVAHDFAWSEVQNAWSGLTWGNRQIAEAKALVKFGSKPTGTSSYDWDNRFRGSKGQWQIQEIAAFQVQRALYTLGGAVGTFIGVLLVLAVCGWLWRATLARIRELANAVRGK